MAPRPPKPCKQSGCRALSREANGYCPEHQQIAEAKERVRRGSGHAGYGRAWGKIRERVLKAEPFCRKCKAGGLITPATHVHHQDANPCNNARSNLVPLCFECHEKIHGRKR